MSLPGGRALVDASEALTNMISYGYNILFGENVINAAPDPVIEAESFFNKILQEKQITADFIKINFANQRYDEETISLDLSNAFLNTLPEEIFYFKNLKSIDLRYNNLTVQTIINTFCDKDIDIALDQSLFDAVESFINESNRTMRCTILTTAPNKFLTLENDVFVEKDSSNIIPSNWNKI
ncbi:MAG: hypothetical protein V4494_08285 [Chlamydiota bacterium]